MSKDSGYHIGLGTVTQEMEMLSHDTTDCFLFRIQ